MNGEKQMSKSVLFSEWKESFNRKAYLTMDRGPFFDIAIKYLPKQKDSIIVDIGSGEGSFYKHIKDKLTGGEIVYLLDGNSLTVGKLHSNKKLLAMLYTVPNKLPFKKSSVSLIHCSHLIEHLVPEDLYKLMKEIDRVLKKDGIIVISAPMFWTSFYEDLSHHKPYHPGVMINYLTSTSQNRSRPIISSKYIVEELVYRYNDVYQDQKLSSNTRVVDLMLFSAHLFKTKILKIKKLEKNGYTIVLRKA